MIAEAPLLQPSCLEEVRAALQRQDLDGWLLYDFQDQNPLAHQLLGLGKTTRRGFALFPADGEPAVLHHDVDASAWRDWPWTRHRYVGWNELPGALRTLLAGRTRVAMEISPGSAVPTLDRVPAGMVELVRSVGIEIVTSADLVTVSHARWSSEGLAGHRRTAQLLRQVAFDAFRIAAEAAHEGSPRTEGALKAWILDRLREAAGDEQTDCVVAAGAAAADPHYDPGSTGQPVTPDTLLLIDLWGGDGKGGIPADQTWMGFLGADPPDRIREVWDAVRESRDRALTFLAEQADRGDAVRGFEVDDVARRVLERRGFGPYFVHRLGHSIDHRVHGFGPNLDHFETRDDRRLLPGIGFSVEPGVYIPGEFGVRSEVNVHLGAAGPEVTPAEIQTELLCFPAGA